MSQLPLFVPSGALEVAARPIFDQCADGQTYAHAEDHARLARQRESVWEAMTGARWRTLGELAEATGYPEASLSARLRDFRKPRFGGHTVDRRRRSPGTFEYRVLPA